MTAKKIRFVVALFVTISFVLCITMYNWIAAIWSLNSAGFWWLLHFGRLKWRDEQ